MQTVRSPGTSSSTRLAAAALTALIAACGGGGGLAPSPGFMLSATNLATSESGTTASFQVALATPPASTVLVTVTTADTTEGLVRVPGSTFPSTWGQVQFTPTDWASPRTITIVPQDDAMADGNVTYSVTVAVGFTTDTSYLAVPPRVVSVTNGDDDTAGVTLGKTLLATSETGPTTDSFTVVLNSQPTATVTLPVTSTDPSEGLVRAGASSAAASVSLTFTSGNWNVPQTVTVVGQDDLVADGNQTYSVTVGPATGAAEYAALGTQSPSVTNADDDTAGVTVLPSATPIVTSENGTTGTFTVRLNSQPIADVVLPVSSGKPAEGLLSGDGQGPAASIALVFTAVDWNVARTVTLTGQDDLASPVLGDNVAYTVTVGPATGADPVYPGLAAIPVAALNTDNDVATFSIPQAGGAPLQTSESGTTATFAIQINKAPSSNVVLPVTVSDVTEGLVRGGSSPVIAASAVNVTFTPLDWQTPQTITVVGQPDIVVDGNQTYSISVGPPTGDAQYAVLPAQAISITNADVNTASYTVSTTAISHTEGGTPATFTVRLNTQPLAPVTVPVASGDPAEGLVAGGDSAGAFVPSLNLTFDSASWSTPQTVSAKGVVDHVIDGTRTYAITVGPTASNDPPYGGLGAKTVSVTSYDADVAGFTVTPTSGLATSEAGGTATFSVVLATIPTGTVNVPVSVSAPGEVLVSAGGGAPVASISLAFTASNWNVPQVVTAHGVDDAYLDGARDFVVAVGPTNSGDAHYSGLAARAVTGTNADDEVGVSEGATGGGVKLVTVPYAGTVGTTYSYYRVTGLTPGNWAVGLSGVTADVALDVYSNANFNGSALLCSSNAAGRNAAESCIATLASGADLYVRVSGTATALGAAFVLDVRRSQVYASADVPKAISATSPSTVTSTLTATGATTAIAKVIVRLGVTHTYDGDLTITLVHAATGTRVTLVQNRGGSLNDFTNTVFDDAAAVPISSGSPPFTGTFRPEQPLSALAGLDANGTWTLEVVDSYSGDGGSLNAWSIEVY